MVFFKNMNNRLLKDTLYILAIVSSMILIKQFCYKKTDGFALYKILSSLSYHQDWEPASSAELENTALSEILNQPFYYLAKGAQSYVFASQDGTTVIKFFRLYHLRPPLWLSFLAMPPALQSYKLSKMIDKRNELAKDFTSYKIAFEEMKEETGLIYLHLNKTSHLKKHLKIYDKIGIAYELDLDEMEFLVQKRATLVYPSIDALMKAHAPEDAKEAISALIQLLKYRCEKGIFDKDPDLNTNFGFLDNKALQIDIGRFRRETLSPYPNTYRDEIIRITDNFRQWLDARYPMLSEHLAAEIQKIPV
nr:hypothetical protein [uncultured bacterium]